MDSRHTGAVTVWFRSFEPAAPPVDVATVWMDTVQHGTMIRQVRGPGTLVPEQRFYVVAVTGGRVDEIVVLPGTTIEENTVIIRISNPDVDISLLQAQQSPGRSRKHLLRVTTPGGR